MRVISLKPTFLATANDARLSWSVSQADLFHASRTSYTTGLEVRMRRRLKEAFWFSGDKAPTTAMEQHMVGIDTPRMVARDGAEHGVLLRQQRSDVFHEMNF